MSRDDARRPRVLPSGNELLASGLGVGALGVLGAVVAGAVCPLCVVATPALVGVGLVQKWRERQPAAEPPPAAEPR